MSKGHGHPGKTAVKAAAKKEKAQMKELKVQETQGNLRQENSGAQNRRDVRGGLLVLY